MVTGAYFTLADRQTGIFGRLLTIVRNSLRDSSIAPAADQLVNQGVLAPTPEHLLIASWQGGGLGRAAPFLTSRSSLPFRCRVACAAKIRLNPDEDEMRTLAPLVLVVALSSFGQLAAAEKVLIPQQGTTTYVTYYTGHSLASLDMGDVGNEALWELTGVTRNTDGQKLFDQMSVRCLFYRTSMDGKVGGVGACTETDVDGDKVFATFDASKRMHTLIGGTGKYKGITGTAQLAVTRLLAPGEGWDAFVIEHKMTWQLK